MATGRTHRKVSAALERLNDAYDSFSVNQSSVSVDRETFEQVADRTGAGVIDVDVKIQRESSVLVVETDGMVRTPHGTITTSEAPLEIATRELVQKQTGVHCHVVDVESATILAIHDAAGPEHDPVYRLSVLFEAMYTGGEPAHDAHWQRDVAPTTVAHPAMD